MVLMIGLCKSLKYVKWHSTTNVFKNIYFKHSSLHVFDQAGLKYPCDMKLLIMAIELLKVILLCLHYYGLVKWCYHCIINSKVNLMMPLQWPITILWRFTYACTCLWHKGYCPQNPLHMVEIPVVHVVNIAGKCLIPTGVRLLFLTRTVYSFRV